MSARLDRLELILSRIAGKNDLSQSSDEDFGLDAQHALHECELLAREGLEEVRRLQDVMAKRNTEAVRRIMFAKLHSNPQ